MSVTTAANHRQNQRVAGLNSAHADETPFPAQEHLEAWGGAKGAHLASGSTEADINAVGQAIEDGDYEAKGVTAKLLQDEIDRRNEEREDDDKIVPDGTKKADLIAALQADDDTE